MALATTQPIGPPASTTPSLIPTADSPFSILKGKHVTLRPLTQAHIPSLFASVSSPTDKELWTYLPRGGPFPNVESFGEYINLLLAAPNSFPFSIFLNNELNDSPDERSEPTEPDQPDEAVGIISLLNIQPVNHSVEFGHLAYGKKLQRTTGSTEVVYLLLKEAIEVWGFERVEWKCDVLNGPSGRAARRFGWREEGVFLKHMVIKGHRRDTAWFSILDDEWRSHIKESLDLWLGDDNFDEEGKQRRRLEDVRAEIVGRLEGKSDVS